MLVKYPGLKYLNLLYGKIQTDDNSSKITLWTEPKSKAQWEKMIYNSIEKVLISYKEILPFYQKKMNRTRDKEYK